MKYSKIISAFTAVLFTSLCAMAYEFAPLGHESVGMGGAGVANADESLAGYYNPALLADDKDVEISIGGGVSVMENNIANTIDRLNKLANTNSKASDLTNTFGTSFDGTAKPTFSTGQNNDLLEVQNIIKNVPSDNGIGVGLEVNAGVSFGNMAIGGFVTGNAGGVLHASKANTEYIFVNKNVSVFGQTGDIYYKYDPSNPAANIKYNVVKAGGVSIDPYSLGGRPAGLSYDATLTQTTYNDTSIQAGLNDTSKTYIKLTGIAVAEVPFSYGTTIGFPLIGDINVGASLKAMMGTTYDENISADTASGDIQKKLKDAAKTSTKLGVDLGVLYKIAGLNIGLVGKNLNSPKFKTLQGAEITVEPSYRAGVKTVLLDDLIFAADYDLNKAKLVDGKDVQWLGGGLSYEMFWHFLKLSVGAMSNVANPDDFGTVYTAGLQTNFWLCKLNISGQMSQKKGQFDGKSFPKYAKANASLIFNW